MATSVIQRTRASGRRIAINSIVMITTGDITLSTNFDRQCGWLYVECSVGNSYCVGVIPSDYVDTNRIVTIPVGEGYVTLEVNGINANDVISVTKNTSGLSVRRLGMMF